MVSKFGAIIFEKYDASFAKPAQEVEDKSMLAFGQPSIKIYSIAVWKFSTS